MDGLTTEKIDELVNEYVMNGNLKELIGMRAASCNCPVANAIKPAIGGNNVEALTHYVRLGPTYFGRRVDISPRISAFIRAVDSSGNAYTKIRRSTAQRLWQEAKEQNGHTGSD